ncbi:MULTISPECIES: peroxiredoxin family protein [Hyphomonas]|nr:MULTISPECIES: peroxiredoxin family protein [Hyphomonas]|tara:strand:+ start:2558 stop:3169 length:612 start_codon:yes stop_codon:yes gene_type:complete
MIRTASLASLLALLPAAAAAQGASDAALSAKASEAEQAAMAESMRVGPIVGQPAPAASVVGPEGVVSFTDLAGEKGTVVAFFRSADWCPYCKKQLIDLKDAAAPLGDEGWTLIGVSYDSPETLADFKAAKDLPYGLYSDTGSAAIDAFDLRNPDVPAGSRYDGIPHPAIIFISADGTVKAVMREEGYKDRPAVDAVLAMAAAL